MTNFIIFLGDNFWLITLIFTMLWMKRHIRLCGMGILCVTTVWGFVPFVIILLTAIAIGGELIRYKAIGDKRERLDPDGGRR